MATDNVFIPQTGISRDFSPYEGPQGSFSRLVNARLVPGKGRIEQTQPFASELTWSAGTYYNGGNQTEDTNTPSSLLVQLEGIQYSFSKNTARNNLTQVPVYRQTAVPAAVTVNTQCLLVINSTSGLAIALGNTVDIVIDGATTFKWRKNGGSYTTAVPITTTGVSIDSGNATVYFQTATGFNVSDTWSWTRTDWLTDSAGTSQHFLTYDWSHALKRTNTTNFIYFCDFSGRVMVYDTAVNYVRTVGYRPVYGTHIAIFYDHLIVGGYAVDGAITDITGNSDLTDLDNFFATDTNEADVFFHSSSTILNDTRDFPGCHGISIFNGVLYVYYATRIWSTNYNGLPVPFSFQEYVSINISSTFAKPIKTDKADYFLSGQRITKFDGVSLTDMNSQVEELVNATFVGPVIYWGFYDSNRKEVYFYQDTNTNDTGVKGFWVYQELTNSWYYRAAEFTIVPRAGSIGGGAVQLSKSLGILAEDFGLSNSLINDRASGTSLQLPLIETSDLVFNNISQVVDLEGTYLDVFYKTTSGTAYGTTGVTLECSTRVSDQTTPTYPGGSQIGTWTTAAIDGTLSLHCSGRLWRFRIRPTVTSGKAAFGFEFNTLVLMITGASENDIIR